MNKIISALALMTIFTAAYAPFPGKHHSQDESGRSINFEKEIKISNDSIAQTNPQILDNTSSDALALL